jgi:hypothetical protein
MNLIPNHCLSPLARVRATLTTCKRKSRFALRVRGLNLRHPAAPWAGAGAGVRGQGAAARVPSQCGGRGVLARSVPVSEHALRNDTAVAAVLRNGAGAARG